MHEYRCVGIRLYIYSLRKFLIPDGVTTIGDTALYNSGITKIGIRAAY